VLQVTEVDVVYEGAIAAIRRVDLTVEEGEVVALLGANGAGKSSLLRAVSGLLRARRGAVTHGSIYFLGRDVTDAAPAELVAGGLAQCLEGRRIFSSLTVDENLRLGGFARSRRDVPDELVRMYAMFPALGQRRSTPGGLLSGGEQQMLAIARALMSAPRLLLLDEPSLGLAPLVVEGIGKLIAQIRDAGTSVLIVEQNAGLAFEVADRGYVLDAGEVVLQGTVDRLRSNERVADAYLAGSVVTHSIAGEIVDPSRTAPWR
jgi:branched-chain amino acid transport system ATP-binding protein